MAHPFQQAQADGLCLRYPDNLGQHRELSYEAAVGMLNKAISLSQNVPYVWGYVDKPAEGQIILLFMPPQSQFPIDGIRYQDQEKQYMVPIGPGPGARELEIHEVKFGFVPGQDPNAWRVRRRYRLNKGGHPQLVLVHYTRGPQAQIVPTMNQPVRAYPLRTVNEPAVYVMGDKVGQKVYPQNALGHGAAPMSAMPPPGMGMGMNFGQPQTMVAQQNANMEMLERKRERERASGRDRSGSAAARPPRIDDDESGDEADMISTRTLALTRYKRNHDLMNEVFMHAAFGDKSAPQRPTPMSIFDKSELEEKSAKLQAEIEALKAKTAARKTARASAAHDSMHGQSVMNDGDVSMDFGQTAAI